MSAREAYWELVDAEVEMLDAEADRDHLKYLGISGIVLLEAENRLRAAEEDFDLAESRYFNHLKAQN